VIPEEGKIRRGSSWSGVKRDLLLCCPIVIVTTIITGETSRTVIL
jgi:hypothetical protein